MPELPPPPPPPLSIGEAIADVFRRRRPQWLTARLAGSCAAGCIAVVAALVALGWAPARSSPPEIVLPQVGTPGDPGYDASAPSADGGGDNGTDGGPAVVAVHAAGSFARPGLYELPAGARVAQLVEAAGGPAEGASLDALNLAAKLNDGERVYLPREGESAPAAPGVASAGASGAGGIGDGLVDLNAATLEQLDALPGVGPSTAQAILDYREEHGRFRSVEELLEVRGIGEAKLAALRKRVRV